tara:strand:+ start:757 stop:1746 length:990 start_codon:yes stop_codon:yes gene_type:complete
MCDSEKVPLVQNNTNNDDNTQSFNSNNFDTLDLYNDIRIDPSNINEEQWDYQVDQLPTCRICLEEDDKANMFTPCRCSGSLFYVHRACLNEWRATSNNPDAFNRCFTCNYTYRTNLTENNLGFCGKLNFGNPKYYCGFYIINFIGILIIGMIIRLLDTSRKIPLFWNKYMNFINFVPEISRSSLPVTTLFNYNNSTGDIPISVQTPVSDSTEDLVDFFDYYVLASYIYFFILLIVFGITILKIKNRKLYIKYLIGGNCCIVSTRICCLVFLTLLCLTTSTIIGCFIMTCIIQAIARHHYNYLNHLNRAAEVVILPYEARYDTELDVELG